MRINLAWIAQEVALIWSVVGLFLLGLPLLAGLLALIAGVYSWWSREY